jgi:hypothetical protein
MSEDQKPFNVTTLPVLPLLAAAAAAAAAAVAAAVGVLPGNTLPAGSKLLNAAAAAPPARHVC